MVNTYGTVLVTVCPCCGTQWPLPIKFTMETSRNEEEYVPNRSLFKSLKKDEVSLERYCDTCNTFFEILVRLTIRVRDKTVLNFDPNMIDIDLGAFLDSK